jgi:hypothetical protein
MKVASSQKSYWARVREPLKSTFVMPLLQFTESEADTAFHSHWKPIVWLSIHTTGNLLLIKKHHILKLQKSREKKSEKLKPRVYRYVCCGPRL